MKQKYRNSGITPAFGRTKVAYVEACCAGGGSEINAGLYHRLPAEIINHWREEYQIADFEESNLEPFFISNEEDLSISYLPYQAGPASMRLKQGADAMNWNVREVPKWSKYKKNSEGTWQSTRQSMTETYIPRALAAGCQLLAQTQIIQIKADKHRGKYALARVLDQSGRLESMKIHFNTVFVCGGTIQTPTLLRRSGIKRNIGNTLKMHLMVKFIARFKQRVNTEAMEIPVHQVKEFAPQLSFGCSISSLPYLALGLLNQPDDNSKILQSWPHLAIYYVSSIGTSCGTVRSLPFFVDPLVRYPVTNQDLSNLAEGFNKLGQLLFASGAIELFPSVQGFPSVKTSQELGRFIKALPSDKTSITTIHLFSTCPMGEKTDYCAVNSYGKLNRYHNIYISDGSILPEAPSVNPQGTIMALARRNALKFLEGV